ncbi:hypothetical protein EV13_1917 [Prochlorococcus sp. MIT 0702]|nr:hypothetical protein EV13_1917 [Prochlorococcus sp. MIT 0702]
MRKCCRSSNRKLAKQSFPGESSWTQAANISHQSKSCQEGSTARLEWNQRLRLRRRC